MKHAVGNVIRLVAAGIIVIGGMSIVLEFARYRLQSAEPDVWQFLLGSCAIVAGLALFAASSRLAARWTGDSDD
jgi:hypothetical protein